MPGGEDEVGETNGGEGHEEAFLGIERSGYGGGRGRCWRYCRRGGRGGR